MKASKEQCERARQDLAWVAEMIECHMHESERTMADIDKALVVVGEFLNAAKRKLPTEAAYLKDAQRKKERRREPAAVST